MWLPMRPTPMNPRVCSLLMDVSCRVWSFLTWKLRRRKQREQLVAVGRKRLVVERLDRGHEFVVLIRLELGDLAALIEDRLFGVLVLFDREIALERDRVLHGLLHRRLHIAGPRVEGRAV